MCEGATTTVTIQDNSLWDCQTPTLPIGFTPIPNSETRNIEWLYGVDPVTGSPDFSISGGGLVNIATLGDAPQQSVRFTPTPYGSSSLSQTITIPATCVAGDYFTVHLKNWNKCNPLDADYISTSVTINVIAAPAAPIAPDKSVCFGSDRTLEVTSTPDGIIDWFSDAGLTTLVEPNSLTYLPPETAVGTYYKWVTDKSITGLGCRSEATMVELEINPIPSTPTISFTSSSGSLVICKDFPVAFITLSAGAVAGAPSYQWYQDGFEVVGAVNQNLTLYNGEETGSYTVSAVGPGVSACPSVPSSSLDAVIYAVDDLANPTDVTVCEGTTCYFNTSSTDPNIQRYQWQYWNLVSWMV